MKKTLVTLFFTFTILFLIYLIGKTVIGNVLLKGQGVCKMAVLSSKTTRIKYQKSTLVYSFTVGNKQYEGNSLEEDLSKIADSVCIVYMHALPSINRPVRYFKVREISCSCN